MLSRIHIRNFRRLLDVSVDFDSQETVFVGPNNSGKTSATAALRSFLGNRDFKIHDFSVCKILDIDTYEIDNSDQKFPSIELDLWFEIDPNTISFGQAFALTTGLSADFSTVGMQCALSVKDEAILFADYHAAFPLEEDETERKKPLSHFLGLDGVFKRHFEIGYASLEKVTVDGVTQDKVSSLVPSEGKKVLNSLLRVDFVDAQRNIDDENAARSNKLSEAFASYYRKNLTQVDTIQEAVEVIEENNQRLTDHYERNFEPLMTTISGLGVPSINDRALRIVSTLSSETALRGNTELLYVDENSSHELPEAYNGLGYKNLVYMAIQIDHFHRQWLDTEIGRALCQVIFVEEPEVHLHAQVQQTFIQKMWAILRETADTDLETPQLAITTHSSHILDAVDFSKVRYFRRCGRELVDDGGTVHDTTEIHSLRDFTPNAVSIGDEKHDAAKVLDFLKKYLKLTHCDLFFADGVVLVEGSVEKLLIPKMVDKESPELNSKYLTILEVGGAYALRFEALLEFLNIPYLVITDIDSVDPTDKRKSCMAKIPNAVSSNPSIKNYFSEDKISTLSQLDGHAHILKEGNAFVGFQKPTEVAHGEFKAVFHGRTLEEAFVFENLEHHFSGALTIGVELTEETDEIDKVVYERIRDSTFKKTAFALDVLSSDVDWNTPTYIKDGLQWFVRRLNEVSVKAEVVEAGNHGS